MLDTISGDVYEASSEEAFGKELEALKLELPAEWTATTPVPEGAEYIGDKGIFG